MRIFDMKQKLKQTFIFVFSVMILVFIDQLTKYFAVCNLKNGEPFVILPGIFELRYLENTGAAFGIMQGAKVLFLMITIVMIGFILYVYFKLPAERKYHVLRVICMVIEAGAIGNMIDRIRQDFVIDFFYFRLINFPIFNVADIYVTVSVFCLIICFLFYYKEEELEKIYGDLFHRQKKKDEEKKN